MLTIEEFVNGIDFRLLRPEDPVPRGYRRGARLLRRMGIDLEAMNTRIPDRGGRMRCHLAGLNRVARMSTFAIGAMINHAVSLMPAEHAFVNVGVWRGFMLFAGMAGHPRKRCVGIDNFSKWAEIRGQFLQDFEKRRSDRHHFHEVDFAEYLTHRHLGPIGVYVYDADHTAKSQRLGLELAEPHLAPGAIVMVDDTCLESARAETLEFVARRAGRYRVVLDRVPREREHPTFWCGILIIQKTG